MGKNGKKVAASVLCTFILSLFLNGAVSTQATELATSKVKTEKKEVERTVPKVKTKFIGVTVNNPILEKDDNNDNVATFLDKEYYDTSSNKNAIKEQLKTDYSNGKYILIHGKDIDNSKVSDILGMLDLPAKFDIIEDEDAAKYKTIAYGIKEAADCIIFATYVVSPEDKDISIQTNSNQIAEGIVGDLKLGETAYSRFVEKDTAIVQDINNDPDYYFTRSFSWDNGYIGRMTSTTYFERVLKGSSESVWDVKQSNTTTGGYSLYSSSLWDTDYLWTRLSTEGRSGEATIGYGPTTTSRGSTASVGLSASGPSVGWSWSTNGVSITDLTYLYSYGRWMFNYAYFSNEARYNYQTTPGIRATNTSGNFYMDPSQHIQFVHETSRVTYDAYTGTYTYNVSDR